MKHASENRCRARVRWRCLRALLPVALALASVSSGPAAAELRVLLAFDNDGYRVTRVVRDELPAAASAERSAGKPPAPFSPAPIAPLYGEIRLIWIDREGRVLANRRAPDPRIAHPAAVAGEGMRRVALERGAWLASGPDEAVTLLLRLPARAALALPAAEWRFDLEAAPSSTRRRR